VTTSQMETHVRCAVSHEHVRHGSVLLNAMFFPNSPVQTTTWLLQPFLKNFRTPFATK